MYLIPLVVIGSWIVAVMVFLLVAVVMGYRINRQENRANEIAQHSVTVEVD
ncbi:MAG: hypothetical protein JOZ57_02540 [Abitibacteriaceae bacterium]|nr:hypothetical protein [Abditibacteriaceae bacterium]